MESAKEAHQTLPLSLLLSFKDDVVIDFKVAVEGCRQRMNVYIYLFKLFLGVEQYLVDMVAQINIKSQDCQKVHVVFCTVYRCCQRQKAKGMRREKKGNCCISWKQNCKQTLEWLRDFLVHCHQSFCLLPMVTWCEVGGVDDGMVLGA